MADEIIPGLDWETGPYGRMEDGSYRTCHHCGTVERALKPLPQNVHDECGCPCHDYRMGRLTSEQKNWKKLKRIR